MGVKIKKNILLVVLVVSIIISSAIVFADYELRDANGNIIKKSDFFDPHGLSNRTTNIKKSLPGYVPGEIIIKLNPVKKGTLSTASIDSSINQLNQRYNVISMKKLFVKERKGTILGAQELKTDPYLSNIYKLSLPKESNVKEIAKEYSEFPDVEYAEPNYIYHIMAIPNDEKYPQQWAHQNMESELAWDIETGNENITIAIIDTGVEWNHTDLAVNIWNNTDEIPNNGIDDDNNGYIDDIRGWDFKNDDSDPIDDEGHGTHVAGIAAAVTNNSIGVAGMCWNCKIMPLKFLDSSGKGNDEDSANAIIYAANNNASIISMSFGGYLQSSLLKDALDYAYSKGIVLIAAAGNKNVGNFSYPAAYDNVISVSAIDNTSSKAGFSNYGYWIDIAAPGVDILSTEIDSYKYGDGTSMATPYVSGLAGLLLSKNSDFSPEEVRAILRNSVEDLTASDYIGYGRINAYNAFFIDLALNTNISSLQNFDPLTGIIDIKGTASGVGFINYSLQIGEGFYPKNWTTIIDSLTQKTDETLAVFDTESIHDGTYTIKLTVNSNKGYKIDKKIVYIVNNNSECYSCGDCNYKLNLDNLNSPQIVTLKNDIESCSACITINKENKTFDCSSYTIYGCGIALLDDYNYWNKGIGIKKNNTIIKNCKIMDHDYGVYADYSSHNNKILNINSSYNWIGIYMDNSFYNLIENCSASDNYLHGISGETSHEKIINSEISNNNEGAGIYLESPYGQKGHNNITNNLIDGNYNNIYVKSSYNDIGYNQISNDYYAGIKFDYGADYNKIHHNIFFSNWYAILGDYNMNSTQIVFNNFSKSRNWQQVINLNFINSNFSNNRISGNSKVGMGVMRLTNPNSHFTNNIFINNSDGLNIRGAKNSIFKNNVIVNNKEGIRITHPSFSNYCSFSNVTFEFNNISNNSEYNFYNDCEDNITAQNNWWGVINYNEIADTIYDYYDDSSKGIVDFDPWIGKPPILVDKIECNNGSEWANCGYILYDNKLTKIRANCTLTTGITENVTFRLTNVPDNNTFFDTVVTYEDNGWWIFDNQDIKITDSGLWKLEAECSDNNSNSDYKKEEWLVPWGSLQTYLIEPLSAIEAEQNHFFNFTAGVKCVGGECGNINATLDPYGPDGYNYTAFNSTEPGGDAFMWEEIITNSEGTALWDIGETVDDNYKTAPIDFNFSFYGVNYTTAYVSSNGRVHFTSTGASTPSIGLPSTGYKVIAPVNKDMYVRSQTQVFYKTYNNPKRFIVEYKDLDHYSPSGNYLTYEVILYEDGRIKIQYNSSSDTYSSLGNIGINYASINNYYLFIEYDAPDLHKGEAVTFYPPGYEGYQEGKGVIPMNNGTPFYTINENPTTCYNMKANDICEKEWMINATGKINNSYEFFVIYTPINYSAFINSNQTSEITVTITGKKENVTGKIKLTEGWNLISIPLELENWTLPSPLKSIEGNYSKIYTYINGEWIELKENDIINETIGFWIKMLNNDILVIEGYELNNVTFNLDNGWNLVGYPSLNVSLINETLNTSKIDSILMYNNSKWYSYNPEKPYQLTTLNKFTPGFGYWIRKY